MRHELFISKWRPHLLNQSVGRHWSVKARHKRQDRAVVGTYAKLSGIPIATMKRRVRLTFVQSGRQRRFDFDAPLKSLFDALVCCGLLVDDGPDWCEFGGVEFVTGTREDWGTRVVLEDVGDA